ncbi:HofP DNA utilization family protein, partial [Enterobacter asburiae]
MLLLVCPLLTGARDPFLPVEDRCQIAPLTQWRYG